MDAALPALPRRGIAQARYFALMAAGGASVGAGKPGEAELLVRARGGPRSLFADLTPGRVLDVPAGGGLQTATLAALGFRVCSVDLFPPARPHPGQFWICADANEPLPFRSDGFDYLLCR
ncbi:MAG: hypothetical protein JO121_30120, partial [Deltaproteobacteria bacterium]|nr:hypothetical protein [Deltaproteobacteria bacterium]